MMTATAQECWRKGFAPCLSDAGLFALWNACEQDDERVIQGGTTKPPSLLCTEDWPVEAGCAVAYSIWQGESLTLVGDVHERFAAICFAADNNIGEPAGCRWFLNWFDKTPRAEMRHALAEECQIELRRRGLIRYASQV